MSGGLTPEEWIRERLDNCQRIAATKDGSDRDGWLEDAAYFSAVLATIAAAPALVEALAWFLEDERFQVAVGGNPNVVERMLTDARSALALARGGKANE